MLANKVLAATIAILLLTSVALVSVPTTRAAQASNGGENGNGNGNGNGNSQTDTPLSVSVSPGTTDITRGSTQTLHIVTNEPEAHVYGYVQYASGAVPRIIVGETDAAGKLDYEWTIGARSTPGVFTARVLAISGNNIDDVATATAQFNVFQAGQQPAPTPTPEPVANETVIEPVLNETDVVIAPVNETTVVTPENATDGGIEIPVNDTSVVIPTNETIEPEPTTNQSEVIIVEQNETEIITPENATVEDIEIEIPPDVVLPSNDTVVIAPANESEVTNNETAAEEVVVVSPAEEDVQAGIENDTQVVCIAEPCPGGNITETTDPNPQPGNVTTGNGTDVILDEPVVVVNETAPGPIDEVIANVTDEVDQAVDDLEQGDPTAQEQLNVAMVNAINAVVNIMEETVPGLTEEDVQTIQLDDLNNALEKALAIVPQT